MCRSLLATFRANNISSSFALNFILFSFLCLLVIRLQKAAQHYSTAAGWVHLFFF